MDSPVGPETSHFPFQNCLLHEEKTQLENSEDNGTFSLDVFKLKWSFKLFVIVQACWYGSEMWLIFDQSLIAVVVVTAQVGTLLCIWSGWPL